MLVEGTLFILAVIFVMYRYCIAKDKLSHIPGPKPWPILGNTLQLDMTGPPLTVEKWAKQFGPVFRINLGGEDHIVITGTDTIHEALIKRGHDYENRIEQKFRFKVVTMDYSDLTFMHYGETYKQVKKIMMRGLKQHNLKHIEEVTLDIVDDLLQDFYSHKEQPFDPKDLIYTRIFQFLYAFIFSQKCDESDKDLKKLKWQNEKITQSLDFIGPGPLLDIFPWLRFFGMKTYKDLIESADIAQELYAKWKHEVETGRYDSDCWFNEVLSVLAKNPNILTEKNAIMLPLDFFVGGSLTTTTTLTALFNVLAHHADVQKILQKEVQSAVGDSRKVSFADRANMPYTYACILEITRYISIFPSFFRSTTCETEIAGYKLPKGTQTIINLWTLHHDPDLFPEPLEFKPERFLTSDGKLVLPGEGPRRHLFSFGAGVRVCVGEVLAMTRMFIIVARIMQNFTILPATTLAEQESIHPHDLKLGFVLYPAPYKIRMVPILKTK